jgi:hypothetical protein
VAVVTVSYNTRELTALLLWSLRTIVNWPDLEIVVVDNGSADGSAELLARAAQAGICVLLANDLNRQHGPGLNQGISWLGSRRGPLPAWIWILDSDVVAARPDALSAALAVAQARSAALVGEPRWDPWHQVESFGLYSLLMDPAVVWQQQTGPFADDGDPLFDLLPRPHGSASAWRPSRSPPGGTSFTVAGAASPGSTPPMTARTPTTSGPSATMTRTSARCLARTSEMRLCCRHSAIRPDRLPEQPRPQPAGTDRATGNRRGGPLQDAAPDGRIARPLLAARGVGRIGLVCSQPAGTVGWWLTWLIFRQIGTHR